MWHQENPERLVNSGSLRMLRDVCRKSSLRVGDSTASSASFGQRSSVPRDLSPAQSSPGKPKMKGVGKPEAQLRRGSLTFGSLANLFSHERRAHARLGHRSRTRSTSPGTNADEVLAAASGPRQASDLKSRDKSKIRSGASTPDGIAACSPPSMTPWLSRKTRWFRHIEAVSEASKPEPNIKVPADANPAVDEFEEEGAAANISQSQLKQEGNVEIEAASPVPFSPSSGSTGSLERQQKMGGAEVKEGANGLSPKSSFSAGSAQPGGSSPTPQRRYQRVEILQIAEGTQLIEPSEVVVSHGPASILTAEPILTPIEQLRRKDAEIRKNFDQKRALVAEILHVPPSDFETIADIATEAHETSVLGAKEPQEIIIASMNQAMRVHELVNEALLVSEEDAIAATSGETGGSRRDKTGASQSHHQKFVKVSFSTASRLTEASSTLSKQMGEVMHIVQECLSLNEQLRKELRNAKEQRHNSIREECVDTKLSGRRRRLGNREKRSSGAGLTSEAESQDSNPALDARETEKEEPSPAESSPSAPVDVVKSEVSVEKSIKMEKEGKKKQSDEAMPQEGADGEGGGGHQRGKVGKKHVGSSGGKQKRGGGKALLNP
ncbi:unnamed protein product [Notodromas monacha]|uniref:Uncharacterized protein n=1 Tax=Notodromas monacha TaxID=399045 RepID=A0A7R9GAU1_9CRUS|nr:unnamed protein product [Notodromas monacha]CAG0914093.1 unnamed protein product [Notodromas monacha]